MHQDTRLAWVHKNRRGSNRAQRAIASVRRLAGQLLEAPGSTLARQAARVIVGAVDEDFRNHCRVGVANEGTLIVYVDDPALVAGMRLRWSAPLRQAFSRIVGGRQIGDIAFRYGAAGVGMEPSTDEER